MKIEKKFAGKWVAIKKDKVVESDLTLTKLSKKVENRKDHKSLHFTLIPNGFIAG
ncbi:hypothetical protein HYW83_02385 [Candidatus Peregrinibacteria bacterium]|nr:hypothetical protein [Candidatus Peregrinibacteria bacterium]